jgi:hypothetical protein
LIFEERLTQVASGGKYPKNVKAWKQKLTVTFSSGEINSFIILAYGYILHTENNLNAGVIKRLSQH